MLVEQIWTGNNGRNFNYLVACSETGEALAIDPLDHEKCLARAKAKGWTITQILNTHEHRDHTGGNDQVVAATRAKLLRTPITARGSTASTAGSGRRRHQDRQDRRARMPRHAGPHDGAYLRALARRPSGAVLRRHAVQRRRRQLPQWRASERALQHLLAAARQVAGEHADLSRPRLHREQSALYARRASPTTPRPRRCCRKMEQQSTDRALVTTLALEREINTFFRLATRR